MNYQKRITKDNIVKLNDNEIFVFGSNESGRHGKGAAKTALAWGAKYGQAFGIQGKTFGIPTVDASVKRSIPLYKIEYYVERFIDYAKEHPELTFLVTEIGCGLAGFKVKDIAPLFVKAIDVENIHLPSKFWHKLENI